jgi:UDP-N-acetyl-D-mannosaminuronic acid dehydrogenase
MHSNCKHSKKSIKTISIVGLGYIGLPTAIIAAQSGYMVHGYDVDKKRTDAIDSGDPFIQEPEIEKRLQDALISHRFSASTELKKADVFILAVPTPFKEEKKADLSYVYAASKVVAQKLLPGNLVILESTIPVGTTQKTANIIEKESGLKANQDFFIAHCPERVLPGKIFKELIQNDRIIGGLCPTATTMATSFYKAFVKGRCYETDAPTAEMVKLVENSSRDAQIAFANQVAAMSEKAGINPFEVIKLANKHPRVNILEPGCGVGGHCIAVDPWFLIEGFSEETNLLKTARETNDAKPHHIVETILSHTKKRMNQKVLLLGLTFKPNVDDLRESPALQIAKELLVKKNNFSLVAHEPFIENEKLCALGFTSNDSLRSAIEEADIIAILVKHEAFKKIETILLKDKVIIDPCGLIYEMQERHEATLRPQGFCATSQRSNSSMQ